MSLQLLGFVSIVARKQFTSLQLRVMDHSSLRSEQDFSLGMAGIEGHKTKHSLHATAHYQAGFRENIIQERTGHLKLKGLQQYEYTSDEQHQAVSKMWLAASYQITYEHQLSATNSHTTTTVTLPCQAVPQFSFDSCQVTINNHYSS